MLKSFLVMLQARDVHLYKIETPAHVFSSEFAKFFRTPILYNIGLLCVKISQYSRLNSCEGLLLVLLRLLSLTLFSKLQIYWCFAGLTVSQHITKADHDNEGRSWYSDSCKGKLWNLVWLTSVKRCTR